MRNIIELYNPDVKNWYINESSSPVNSKQLIRKTSEFERTFNKDLYDFDISQYITLLESGGYNSNSYATMRSAIRKYVEWCIDKGLANTEQKNVMKQLYQYKKKSAITNTYKYFINENHVFDIVERLFATQDIDKHIVYRVCCMYALALEQITPAEMCNIKREDINLNKNEFSVFNSEQETAKSKFKMSERTRKYFEEVYYCDKVYIMNSTRCNSMKESEYFFRTTRAGQVDISYFMNVYSRIIKGIQRKLPIGNELRLYDLGFNNIINNKIFMSIYNQTHSDECDIKTYNMCARVPYKGSMTVWDFRNRYKEWYQSTHSED